MGDKSVFKIWVYFSLSCSDFICHSISSDPRVKSVLPVLVFGEWYLSVLIS